MITQTIALGENSYPIMIGSGTLDSLPGMESFSAASSISLVTDSTVWGHYGQRVTAALARQGLSAEAIVLPPGEKNKSLTVLAQVYDAFARQKLRRDGLVIAFGGGVIGDLAGFAAATWMRGVPYVQIPTTLLAQVDSSVGGKTAIDLDAGKNLAGAFYQPKLVIIDPDVLATLAPRDVRGGMAEVIKYGAICDRDLFRQLQNPPAPAQMADIIAACCRIKGDMVQRDERDTGERMLLNFGHTFGHAVESLGGYTRWNHGEAVAIGMVLAAVVGEDLALTAPGTRQAIAATLAAAGLATTCPYTAQDMLPGMALDKKSGGTGVQIVVLTEIGTAHTHLISYEALAQALERTMPLWKQS